ncbi:MAG: glutamate 5-kinase [Oscillospiraceae bacterium]|nr:glutamate 5-kinase [Oscillospiraceae bacterium]
MEQTNRRITVKVGTSTLTHANGTLNLRRMEHLVRILSDLKHAGSDVILVTSGAIAVGVHKLRMPERPTALPLKQAAAAVGQCELMHLYDKFFSEYSVPVAQILLTRDDVEQPTVRENLLNTFHAILELGALPIVNENDSVSHEEIESKDHIFGDNDTLSAVVADMCGADTLVLLSDIDGLYDGDPRTNPDARLIPEVRAIDDTLRALASGAGSSRGTGGMITKLAAADICLRSGIDMIIANGTSPELLYSLVDGVPFGTLFTAKPEAK